MKSEIKSIEKKLKNYLRDKEIIDIILFGSFVKGKAIPNDIDIAIITNKNIEPPEGFHTSIIKPEEFFINPPTLVTTILREGYSLRNKKSLAENLRFRNKVLFTYNLANLSNSKKVRIVNILRGKGKNPGLINENSGEWIANQVFIMPIESENLVEKFLINNQIKYKKSFILMH